MFNSNAVNIILLITNLLPAGALCVHWSRKDRTKAGAAETPIPEAAAHLLEFAVYGAGVIRMADLILQGIAFSGGESGALPAVRILLAESLLLLFPLGKLLQRWKQEENCREKAAEWESSGMRGPGCGNRESGRMQGSREWVCSGGNNVLQGILNEGEYFLGLALLLGLTLQGWKETTELLLVFGRQIWLLFFFFCCGYLKQRRRERQYAGCYWDGADIQEVREGTSFRGNAANTGHADQAEYLRNVEQQYQRTRELWHDLKNHIRVLEILAEEKRFEELTDYLDSFRKDVERRMIPARTGCAPVDALLGDKLYQAGKQDTEMKLELCGLSQTGLAAVDLCVILGNLLDNALEACSGISGEKRIVLRMRREEEFCYITVVNTAEEPVRAGEGYLSAKGDRINGVGHGLGLRSAERTAHRYGGLLVTDYSQGEFKAVVRLQIFHG